jgi:hypothetical protein
MYRSNAAFKSRRRGKSGTCYNIKHPRSECDPGAIQHRLYTRGERWGYRN